MIILSSSSSSGSTSCSSSPQKTSLVKTTVRRFSGWVKAQIDAYKVKRKMRNYAKFISSATNNNKEYFASHAYVGKLESVDKDACREFFNKRNEETC